MNDRFLNYVKAHKKISILGAVIFTVIIASTWSVAAKKQQNDLVVTQPEQVSLPQADTVITEPKKTSDKEKQQKKSTEKQNTIADSPKTSTPETSSKPACVKSIDGFCYIVRNASDRQALKSYEAALKDQPAKVAKLTKQYNACKTTLANIDEGHDDYMAVKAKCERLKESLYAAKSGPVKPFLSRR